MSLVEGYIIGLGMIIFIGPVFFLLLNTSLQSGTKAGLAVALGIIVSDIVCVSLCYYGLSAFFQTEEYQFWIGVSGSLIILGLGIGYMFKKATSIFEAATKTNDIVTSFIKGFSVNFFNPFVFAVWIGVFQYGKMKYSNTSLLFFLVFVLLGILTTDVFKVFLSKKVKRFISPSRLTVFFKITGVVLIGFSIRLLYAVL